MPAKGETKATNSLTTTPQLRLELLKLTFRHDRPAKDITSKARELEEYVTGKASSKELNGGEAGADSPT